MLDELSAIMKELELDGYVFDAPMINNYLKVVGNVKRMLEEFSRRFNQGKKQALVTFSGARYGQIRNEQAIKPFFELFSKVMVNVYDFQDPNQKGHIAPLRWAYENIAFYQERTKQWGFKDNTLMLGLPFYGYQYKRKEGKVE